MTRRTGNVASTVKTLDGSMGPSGANASNGKRRYLVIKQAEEVKMGVSIHETPAPRKGIQLSSDHLELLKSDPFACAIVAVYGFEEQPFYRFLPN